MAVITITAADVALVRIDGNDALETGPAAEAITAGQYVRRAVASGQVELGNGSSTAEVRAGGVALNTAAAGQAVTFCRRGYIDLGDALDALAYDADVFVSNTDGALDTAAGTVSRIVGTVAPGFAATTADKLLRVNLG